MRATFHRTHLLQQQALLISHLLQGLRIGVDLIAKISLLILLFFKIGLFAQLLPIQTLDLTLKVLDPSLVGLDGHLGSL